MDLNDRLDRCLRVCLEAAMKRVAESKPRAWKWTQVWVETRHRLAGRSEKPHEFDIWLVEKSERSKATKQRLAYRGIGTSPEEAVYNAIVKFEEVAGLTDKKVVDVECVSEGLIQAPPHTFPMNLFCALPTAIN